MNLPPLSNSQNKSYYKKRPFKARKIYNGSSGCGCGNKNVSETTNDQSQSQLHPNTVISETVKLEDMSIPQKTIALTPGMTEHSSWLKNTMRWVDFFKKTLLKRSNF
ncbi:hypothetical protein [Bacillus cereus]|uniref:Uncharacterized protein n=1 Tax=Bacillus cereus TaxID=1396 RepID=A0A9X6WTX8_BACCE|nr:hypothetical protein [Bacillus cereus]PFK04113.1 hypothetical protein COI98_32030 [Bacillus cereus]